MALEGATQHTHRGWRCTVERSQWVTLYRARSPDGRFRLTVDYQQAMGDTDIWLRVASGEPRRTGLQLMDPWLAACAVSPDGDRLFVDAGSGRRVYDCASGEELPGAPWPTRPVQAVLLMELFPSLRPRALGSGPVPFRFGPAPAPEPPPPRPARRPALRPALPDDAHARAVAYFAAEHPAALVSRVEVEPTGRVTVETGAPGLLVGRRGATADRVRADLTELLGAPVTLHLVEKRPT